MKKRLLSAALALLLTLGLGRAALAAEAPVFAPSGLFATADGKLLLADVYQNAIWARAADGSFTRLAGRDGVRNVNGVPTGGYHDATAAQAAFASPWAIAPYLDGWAVSDTGNHVIRYLSNGVVRTLAGTSKTGSANGLGTLAAFSGPTGLAADEAGNLYVADTGNNLIRKIDKTGLVSTWAPTSAGLLEPTGLYYTDKTLYVADSGNDRICQLTDGKLTVLAGGQEDGYRDGPAAQALFSHPQGLTVANGVVYVADTGNGAIRTLQNGLLATLVGFGELADGLYPVSPRGLALVGERLYVGDVFARTLFSVDTAAAAFADVSATAWFAPAVATVSRRGLMNGVSRGQFAPSRTLSRSMCATLLYRLAAPDHQASLPALPDAPGNSAAAWAVAAGVMPTAEGSFLPSGSVTRADFVTYLYRCAKLAGRSVTPDADVRLSDFKDAATLPVDLVEPLRWGLSAGILAGTADNRLSPSVPITRAQAAVMLNRYLLWAS